MKKSISRAESFCKSLRGESTQVKESKLYAKFGATLGTETCKSIAQNF